MEPELRWYLLESGPGGAGWNMALDEALLCAARELGRPVLRFYSWTEPAATFGYSQRYREVAVWTPLRPLVRRPTGGGLVPHAADWTYSVVVPPGHTWHGLRARESYARIHGWVCGALRALGWDVRLALHADGLGQGQCFAGAEALDVVADGRKLAGAAQRRNRRGLLIQGSVQPPPGSCGRGEFRRAMQTWGTRECGWIWEELRLPEPILELASELESGKYVRADYNEVR